MKSPDNTTPQQDFTRFYSLDPYVVLGVARTATEDDVKKARKRLQVKFHPDSNKDPRAQEISQNINNAYDALPKRGTSLTRESPLTTEILEEEILSALQKGGWHLYEYLFEKAHRAGITKEQIKDEMIDAEVVKILNTAKVRKILKDRFLSSFLSYWSSSSDKFGAQVFLQRVTEWSYFHVDISDFINFPEFADKLESESKITLKANPKEFKPYVKAWMEAGWKPSKEIKESFEKQP